MRTLQIRMLVLLVAGTATAADSLQSPRFAPTPSAPLTTLSPAWNFMGNGGPQALPGRCEVGIDSSRSGDGSVLYSIRCTNTALPSFGGARTSFDVAPWRGKRVRVSAELMADSIETVPNPQYPNAVGEAGLWVGVGTPRDGLRSDRMQNRTLKGTSGWEIRDFVVDIPADAGQLQAGYYMQGRGQVWMRDLKVEGVPTTVAVNYDRNVLNPDAAVDVTLAVATVPRPGDRFLPPPPKWLALGEQNFELCDAGVDAALLTAGQRNLTIACGVPVRVYLRQAFVASPWWGKRVRLSAWVKAEKVEPRDGQLTQAGAAQSSAPGAALYLAATDTRGPVYNAVVTGTQDWKFHEIVIDIPSGAPYIPMGLSLNGTGQVWLRDLRFEEVARDTPVTSLPAGNRWPARLSS